VKRILFVVPPFAGHINPTVSVARTLAARGHRVAWVAHAGVRSMLPPEAEVLPVESHVSDAGWSELLERSRAVRGLESFQFLWEEVLIPLARGMRPGVAAAYAAFRPDAVAVDHQAIAGALEARRAGIPWATFCTTSASVVDPLADLPKVKEWVSGQLARLEVESGLEPIAVPDMSPSLVVVFSTEAFVGTATPWPASYRFVGPSIQDRPEATPFPWEALAPGPRVFVSLGTVSREVGARFYATVVQALREVEAQIVIAAPPGLVPDPPASFLVRERVPQLALLPKMNAVVCHAGHNTVCESLANGLPLVVAPIRDDQPVVAQQVVNAGAGVRVRYGRLSAEGLREAVLRVLREPELRRGAERVRESFRSAGGASATASALEELA
jgi:MGT family glycosyltransferase